MDIAWNANEAFQMIGQKVAAPSYAHAFKWHIVAIITNGLEVYLTKD